MLVKIARLGQQVKEVALNDGTTVATALSIVGVSLKSGEALKVQGNVADENYVLHDGDIVTLVPNIEGGKKN